MISKSKDHQLMLKVQLAHLGHPNLTTMKKIILITAFTLLCVMNAFAQRDVRAWNANGQVFVVWKIDPQFDETYGIYASPTSFTQTSNAAPLGRLFKLEYSGYGLKDNLDDTTATFKIPDGQDSTYQLAQNEGVFVFTPHQSDSLYFAVVKWGTDTVVSGLNITSTAVPFVYDPINDPVECHLQRTFESPFDANYVCFAYCMWADGRQNHWEGRPDFPIMANAAKNGMPGVFLVSVPKNLDHSIPYPLSVWLHGGEGIARQSLAGRRKEIDINPIQGILLAHDDKMYGYRGGNMPHPGQTTWHFGWGKNYNPFAQGLLPADTIINYTQRRYFWIDEWLAKKFNIDTNRINIHGYSMGSAGALGMAKCFPNHYGSATIFNTGCAGPTTANSVDLFGSANSNFPTNLINRKNVPVRFYDLWDLYTNCSPQRDLPLIRHWHGKTDKNPTMKWSPTVVSNFRMCDSIATGIQNYWSERDHGIGNAPSLNDHWIMGIPAAQQTATDNVDYAEAHHRSDESFPAFFNHRKDAKNNDPGTGQIGINNGDGDNWGTWGGYHRWENVMETPQSWQITAWLENSAIFLNDNAPTNFLTANLAIRRPQVFMPAAGESISWNVKDLATGSILQHGTATVFPGNLVVIPQLEIFKENIRKVRITVTHGTTSIEASANNGHIRIFPNPTHGAIFTDREWATVSIIDMNGQVIKRLTTSPQAQILEVSFLPAGLYFVEILTKDQKRKVGRLVKL